MTQGLRAQVAENGVEGQLLARMDGTLTALVEVVHEVKTDVAVINASQQGCAKVQDDRWDDHKEAHKELNRRSNLIDGAVALGVAAAAWFGIKA